MIQIQEVSDIHLAFPTGVKDFIPPYDQIPEDLRSHNHPLNQIASIWFSLELGGTRFIPREGVDPDKALSHIGYVMRSWDPKHEHKLAGVAYLMDLWFSDIQLDQNHINQKREEIRREMGL